MALSHVCFYFGVISTRRSSRQRSSMREINNLRNGGITLCRCTRWMLFLYICLKFRKSSCSDQFLHFSAVEKRYISDLTPVPFQTRTENFPLSSVAGCSMLSGNLLLTSKVHLTFDRFSSYFKKELGFRNATSSLA